MEEKSFETTFYGTTYNVHYVKSPSNASIALEALMKKDCLFAVDTETEALPEYKSNPKAGLSPHLSRVRLLQVFDGTNVVVFDLKGFPERQLQMFVPFLSTKRLVAHFAVFEIMQFLKFGVQYPNISCTLILAKLLFQLTYPDDNRLLGLEALAESILKTPILKHVQKSDWSVPELTFEQIEYAAIDTVVCMNLAKRLAPGIEKYGLQRIYALLKDAQHPIARMQVKGFRLDVERHRRLIPAWIHDLVEAEKEVKEITGIAKLTNPEISKWLETNLDAYHLSVWPRTDSGLLSTSSDTFTNFSYLEVVEPFSRFQKKAILSSTFGQKLINRVNPKTGLLHANYKILGARTGRLSCSDPNLQNLPRDNEIRRNFIPKKGSLFLCADYSQIELRIAAEISGDKQMLTAYREGIDLHRLTASKILGKPIGKVTDKERQIGKALGLGLLYGLGAKKFSQYVKKGYAKDNIAVSQDEAHQYIEAYRKTYSGFRKWQLKQSRNCELSLKAVTPLGKIRKLSSKTYYGEGLNVPVQGAAAEVMLAALVRLDKAFEGFGDIVNCIHDEVIIEYDGSWTKDEMHYAQQLMVKEMTKAYLDVFPNGVTRDLVEAKFGLSWAECKSKEPFQLPKEKAA